MLDELAAYAVEVCHLFLLTCFILKCSKIGVGIGENRNLIDEIK